MTTVYIRARPLFGDWACAAELPDGYRYTWAQRHLGLFGQVLARRALGLPTGSPVEFRLL